MKLLYIIINNPTAGSLGYAISNPESGAIVYKFRDAIAELNKHSKVAVVALDNSGFYHAYDFGKMQEEYNFTTWDTVKYAMSHNLTRYKTEIATPSHIYVGDGLSIPAPFQSFVDRTLVPVSLENTDYGTVHLCDASSPFVRDAEWYISQNNDVVCTDLKNLDTSSCLPIVCGSAFPAIPWTNPETGKKELFALGAGRLTRYAKWNQKKTRTAGHQKAWGVNGVETRGYPGEDYPMEGAYCYNISPLLLDFSAYGSISCYLLKDMVHSSVQNTPTHETVYPVTDPRSDPTIWIKGLVVSQTHTGCRFIFTLPAGTRDGYAIVSICGKLFFEGWDAQKTVTPDGEIVLTLDIERDCLERVVLSNLQHYGRHINDTTNVQAYMDMVLKYMMTTEPTGYGSPEDIERILYSDYQKPFIVMVHTDRQCRVVSEKPRMTVAQDKLVFSRNAHGLLRNRQTGEIIDYVRVSYRKSTLVTYALQCPLNAYHDTDPHRTCTPQLGHEHHRCANERKYMKLSQFMEQLRAPENYELIDLVFAE